jgi:membrane-associated phospholipid phosphatase
LKNHNPPQISFNRYFFIPFFIWVIIGGILLATYNERQLFENVNVRHTETLDWLVRQLTNLGNGFAICGILLFLLAVQKFRNWWYLIAAVMCNAVPAIITQIVKGIFNRPRPFERYRDDVSWIHFSPEWGQRLYHHSFPSGHSAGAFSIFLFVAMLLPKRYQIWGFVLFFLALGVAYSRLYLAAHFFLDVYVGSIIGVVFTSLGFYVMRRYLGRFYGANELEMGVEES